MSRGSLLGLLLLYVLVIGMSLLVVANRHHSRCRTFLQVIGRQ